jgi:hypothetical protein
MRTKTLLLTAAVTAAGLASSMAQVFSVNAVGYVKLTIGAGNLALIANPLNGVNNNLNTILPLPDGSDGVTIYRFDTGTQNYSDAITFLTGAGWLTANPDPNALVVNPGEGFFIQNILGTALDLTFVGDVPQGSLANPVPGNGALSIRSSQVPQQAALGDAATAGTLGFPAVEGDTVYIFDVTIQNYKDAYAYLGTPGVDGLWLNASDPNPTGPVLPVANSFFVQKAGAASQSWNRTFSVN